MSSFWNLLYFLVGFFLIFFFSNSLFFLCPFFVFSQSVSPMYSLFFPSSLSYFTPSLWLSRNLPPLSIFFPAFSFSDTSFQVFLLTQPPSEFKSYLESNYKYHCFKGQIMWVHYVCRKILELISWNYCTGFNKLWMFLPELLKRRAYM